MATPTEKEAFSRIILKRAKDHNINAIEAVMDYCEEIGLEVEVAATLLNDELYQKVEYQAKGVNLLKKEPPTKKKAAKKVKK